jgi:hypothetical protein
MSIAYSRQMELDPRDFRLLASDVLVAGPAQAFKPTGEHLRSRNGASGLKCSSMEISFCATHVAAPLRATLTALRWEDTTVFRSDLAAAISELRAKPGGELRVHGSGALRNDDHLPCCEDGVSVWQLSRRLAGVVGSARRTRA